MSSLAAPTTTSVIPPIIVEVSLDLVTITTTTTTIESVVSPTPAPLQAPDSFPQFRNLPMELRLMIWKAAASQDRVLKISHTVSDKGPPHTKSIYDYEFHKLPVPSILHTNQESRQQALRQFTLLKEPRFGPTFFNLQNDTILFTGPESTRALRDFKSNSSTEAFSYTTGKWKLSAAFVEQIHHLAIQANFSNLILNTLSKFQSLQSVSFSSTEVPEKDSLARVQQKVNWAMSLVRENDLSWKDLKSTCVAETEKVGTRLSSMFAVSSKIRRVERQDFGSVALLTDVRLMDGEEFGREFGLEE